MAAYRRDALGCPVITSQIVHKEHEVFPTYIVQYEFGLVYPDF